MSRDNSIFFREPDFPHAAWADLLSLYDSAAHPIDELDSKHLITHKWTIQTRDGRVLWIDLMRLDPSRHSFPRGYHWRIGLHCHSGIPNWLLYAIPILACVRFSNVILWDPHPPKGFVSCEAEGILRRAREVVPTRCDPDDLVLHGYSNNQDPMWPCVIEKQTFTSADPETRNAAEVFCREMRADFGEPITDLANSKRIHAARRWLGFLKW